MWDRKYPYGILLIFAHIFKASCMGTSSLTFAIDDTGSMADDIKVVKNTAYRILDIVFHAKSNVIDNMVLVSINEPNSKLRVITKDRNTFQQALYALQAHNTINYDCPEPSMKGLLLALEKSHPNSYIYVFTDASAKDYPLSGQVMEMCQRKQSQIVFVLTGYCYNQQEYGFKIYYDIAAACSGLAFYVGKESLDPVIKTIEETINGNKTVMVTKTVPPGVYTKIPFIIDDHTEYAVVSVSGYDVSLSIRGPPAILRTIMRNKNGIVVKVTNVSVGQYIATVRGKASTSVIIVGRTDFLFSHGFSELVPKSLADTTPQPIANANGYLSISINDPKRSVNIKSVHILGLDERKIKTLPLIETSTDLYITKPFVAPSEKFQIVVEGIVISTGLTIKRISKIPITPQKPIVVQPDRMKPITSIVEGQKTEVEYDSTVKLTCKVSAYPKPKISWMNSKGTTVKSLSSILQVPYDYISYITISNVTKADKYVCYAVNEIGRNSKTIEVVMKDAFVVKSVPKGTTGVFYGAEGTITCDITSSHRMNIRWYYVDETKGTNGEIISSDKYWISADGKQLKIKKMNLNLVGRYTCKATLKNHEDVQKSFSTRVTAEGLVAPVASGEDNKKATKGSTAVINCNVKGYPKPKISWQFKGASTTKFVPLSGDDSVLRISGIEEKHAGNYKCVAVNEIGINEHITTLIVQDPPKIMTVHTEVYKFNEGDALLKMPCDATGIPKPAIIWKMNGATITPNSKYSIEAGALIIKDIKVGDTNSYTCEAKNEVGTTSATFRTKILQAPKVSGVAVKKVRLGTSDTIECTVLKGVPLPKITWQFMRESATKYEPLIESNEIKIDSKLSSVNVLKILSLADKHAGRYKCVAVNELATSEHVTTLIVEYPPKIMTVHTEVYKFNEGDALLKMPCDATGIPKPAIIWKMNGATITPNSKYSIEAGALIIKDIKVGDTNSYTCEAKNEVGTTSATFRTKILQAPKVSGVAVKKVRLGTSDTIECTVLKGVPLPKITWQFMRESATKYEPLIESNEIKIDSKLSSVNVLKILSLADKHAGRYKCVAVNELATSEHVTTLIVEYPPKIMTVHTEVYKFNEGDALLKMPCDATGIPKPAIIWKMNGATITPNSKYSIEAGALIIKDIKVGDTNSYTCEAKNEVGTTSATFRTKILQAPKVSGVAVKKVRLGTSDTIECTVLKGVPLPKITWQFMRESATKYEPLIESNEIKIDSKLSSVNVLKILSLADKHAGRYKCVAVNELATSEHVTTLIVESPPKIISSTSLYYGVEGDLALRIPCNTTGIPKPTISWKVNGTVIKPNDKYAIEDEALIIYSPKRTDSKSYSYTCEAKNYLGSVSAVFQAQINEFISFGTMHKVYIKEGENRKLNCDGYNSKSQKVTWLIEDNYLKIKEPFVYIEKATVNYDGNYTCRVNDKHGNTYTHTYVVDVGHQPIFKYENIQIVDWRGDVQDVLSNCDSEAKPFSNVTWYYNGKLLTDDDLQQLGDHFKWGRYSCNVSNVHGSIQRSFEVTSTECYINKNIKYSEDMPLILNNDFGWPSWKTLNNHYLMQPHETFKVFCPHQEKKGNEFQTFNKDLLQATCVKQDIFAIDGKNYTLSDLHCKNKVTPNIVNKKTKCLSENSELIRVGYELKAFLGTYDVCFDHGKNVPLYTRALLTGADDPPRTNMPNIWHKYPAIADEKLDKGITCKDSSSTCCYGRILLVNDQSFNERPARESTFIKPLNTILYWRPCKNTMTTWEKINDMVRTQIQGFGEFVAWSGTHTLQEKGGAYIPRYLWKVLKFDEENTLAIVHVNDPSPTDKDIKCRNICTEDEQPWFMPEDKFTYCCSLDEFLGEFNLKGHEIGE